MPKGKGRPKGGKKEDVALTVTELQNLASRLNVTVERLKSRLMQIKIKKVEIHSKQHHSLRPNDIITDNATNLNNDMMYPTFQNSFVNSDVS